MDLWGAHAMDLLGPVLIEFNARMGSFRFIAVECSIDVPSPVSADGGVVPGGAATPVSAGIGPPTSSREEASP
jgi:hypothetical protein